VDIVTDFLVFRVVGRMGHKEKAVIGSRIHDPLRAFGISDVVNARRECNETHLVERIKAEDESYEGEYIALGLGGKLLGIYILIGGENRGNSSSEGESSPHDLNGTACVKSWGEIPNRVREGLSPSVVVVN